MGRPTLYTPEIAQTICERLSVSTPLTDICKDLGIDRTIVYDWMEKDGAFSQQVARARQIGYDVIAQDCLKIADHTEYDTEVTDFGPKPNMEWIQRSKLRVETRLKLLACWDPKRYGAKVDLTSGGEKMSTIAVNIVRPKEDDE